jgi:gamma-glutamyltranspeptidase/glutathione hydrolase
MSRYLRKHIFTPWLFVATFFFIGCAQIAPVEVAQDSRSASGVHGMVAAAHPLASQVGVDILKAGGNAIDAAVAVGFALGVVEPNASGLGGGGMMLIWLAEENKAVFLDFRGRAPAAATGDMFELDERGKVKPDARGFNPVVVGGKASAVPGETAGLLLALAEFGTMSREQIIQPAIDHVERGVPVSKVLAAMITSNYDRLATFPASAEIYLDDGFPKEIGDTINNQDLAHTLSLIVEQGRDGFYLGPVAQSIADAIQADGGLMTLEDLANYQVSYREPVTGNYRGYDIISAPPPSSGGTHVVELLNIMENFDLEEMGLNSAESIHAWTEAMKMMYADRAKYMADSDFVDIPLKGLASKQYAHSQFERIDMNRAEQRYTAGDPWPVEGGSTTHFSVVDSMGNMVACTKSINHFFASGITAPGTGVMMNDMMDDFDKRPGQINSIAPGKKPISSMSPIVLLRDGRPLASLGSPGGKRIITTMALLISNLIDFDMAIQPAIEAPRFNNYETGPLKIESRIPEDVRAVLEQKGHELSIKKDFDLYFGGAQGVVIDEKTGVMHGGGDPRRDGKAIGY